MEETLLLVATDRYSFVGYGDAEIDAKEGTSINLKKAFLLLEMPAPRPDGSGITRLQTLEPVVPDDATAYDVTVRNVHYIVEIADNDVMGKLYANIKAQCSGIHLVTSIDNNIDPNKFGI